MQLVVARIGLDHGIFKIIAENGDKPTSFADLTEKINLKPMVLELLLNYMATHFMVEEVTEKKYKPTSLTQSFLVKHFAHSSEMMHNIITPSMLGLHSRLLQPDSARTAFQFGHKTDLDLYSVSNLLLCLSSSTLRCWDFRGMLHFHQLLLSLIAKVLISCSG